MPKKQPESSIVNRRAHYDYQLEGELSVGVVLTGREVKAVRTGHVSLKGSYVTLRGSELWLNNASFSVLNTQPGQSQRAIETTPRKLLAKKKEITELQKAKDQGLSIVPLRLSTRTRFIKLTIATGKGKKLYDKRQTIKRREQDREAARAIKRA